MKALICGAGIAGLATAWWLERAGWDVVIVEHAPALRDEGYMIDFWDDGYDVAEAMGVLPRLRELAYDVDRVSYVDRGGREVSRIDYDLFSRTQGGRLLTLMRGDLEDTLHAALGAGVTLWFGLSIDRIDDGGRTVTATLTDGSRVDADLLIGADGIHSRVRELAFGAEHRFLRHLGFHTASYVFSDAELAARLQGRFAMRSTPGRVVGCYPIRGGRVAAFFAHAAADTTMPADPRATLRRHYAEVGWVVPHALERCPAPPALYYDVVAQIEMPTWHRGRVALVGDACQAVSLLAGQGASMAMAGAYALAAALADGDVPTALPAYERRVKPVIESKQAAGRRMANWFVPGSPARIRVRDLVLRLASVRALEWLVRPVLTTPSGNFVDRDAGIAPDTPAR